MSFPLRTLQHSQTTQKIPSHSNAFVIQRGRIIEENVVLPLFTTKPLVTSEIYVKKTFESDPE